MSAVTVAVEYLDLQLDHLRPSAVQPRKRFNEFKLTELAKSITNQGVLQPILVRPVEVAAGVQLFEIVAGERRWRSSRMAGLTTAPCRVKVLNDVEAIEIAVIENDQREDLHPLEQAGGYANLLKAHGHEKDSDQGVDALALRIGRSKGYVYGRLKLLELIPDAQELFWEDTMSMSVALRFARMPPTEQGRALKRWLELRSPDGETLSVKKTEQLLKKEFMLRLEGAPFPVADVTLVAAAGACGTCPKRTGAFPDLFGDVEHQDTCTDLTCYDSKRAAQALRRKDAARAQGLEVFEGDNARALLKFGESSTQLGGEYVYMDEPLPDLTGNTTPVAKLLGTHLVPSALFEHPKEKTLREIVHVVKATGVLREQGLLQNVPVDTPAARPSPRPSGTTVATKPERPEREPITSAAPVAGQGHPNDGDAEKLQAFHTQWRVEAFRAYHNDLHDRDQGMTLTARRQVALELGQVLLDDEHAMRLMAQLWNWQLPAWPTKGYGDTLESIIAGMDAGQLDLLIAELVVVPDLHEAQTTLLHWREGSTELEKAVADEDLEVDVAELIAKAKKTVYGKPKAKPKAVSARAETRSTPRSMLPPAGDDKGAPANVAGKPDHEKAKASRPKGLKVTKGRGGVATAAAAGQEGEEQQAQGPGDDDGAKASTTTASTQTPLPAGGKAPQDLAVPTLKPISAWPFPLTDTTASKDHWRGQALKVKATKAIGELRDVDKGVFKVAVPRKGDPTESTVLSLAKHEFIVLPDQVHPLQTQAMKGDTK